VAAVSRLAAVPNLQSHRKINSNQPKHNTASLLLIIVIELVNSAANINLYNIVVNDGRVIHQPLSMSLVSSSQCP